MLTTRCAPTQVIKCIENGLPLLIENLPEDIEAVLDPVISKRTFRRGNATLIRLGDAEVQVHSKFRCRRSHACTRSMDESRILSDNFVPLGPDTGTAGACDTLTCAGQATNRLCCTCRMYLQTKLANPHFKPEVAAQTTLVNFCVTEVGLEEQLLALASHIHTSAPCFVSCAFASTMM